jgi:aspartate/methionine/tyrosine aminotransferase
MNTLRINDAVKELKESSTLAINTQVKKMREMSKEVYHFGFGQSPFPVPGKIVEEVRKYSDRKEYLPTAGLISLREEISSYLLREHKQEFDSKNILIGPGSKELLFQLLYLLEGTVIIPAPSWVSYRPQVQLRKGETKIIQTKKENNYCLSAQELEDFCLNEPSEQKILIVNNPNNPTGHLYKEENIKEISEVCRKYNIILISDEIYSQINFSDEEYISFTKYLPERTIVTGGLSKIFSAGGYRLGYVAIPDSLSELTNPICSMFSETFSSVCSPIQYGAIAAFRKSDEIASYIGKCNKIHEATSNYLFSKFKEFGLDCSRPEGAFYLMVDFENYREKLLKRGIKKIGEIVDILLKDYQVAILPGDDFYMETNSLTARVATVDYDGEGFLKANLDEISFEDVEKYCPNLKNGCLKIKEFLESC